MSWPCFLIIEWEPRTEFFTMHDVPGGGFHRCLVETLAGVEFDDSPSEPPAGWPAACPDCGRKLAERETFKMGTRSWMNPATGEVKLHQHEHGAGAMYDSSEWSPHEWRGADGKCWSVVLPPAGQADDWTIDGPATSGGRWARTGVAPKLTVTPSILTSRYHGFLTDGVLTDSLPDRPLPR